jgi:predicted O-methyltransferase YrrM
MRGGKTRALLSRPDEIPDRVWHKLDVLADRFRSPARLARLLSPGTYTPSFRVPQDLELLIRNRLPELVRVGSPFDLRHCATVTLGRICYDLCRTLRPEVVIETGVAYGVTSAYILRALAENNKGLLHSIDLPPLAPDARKFVGHFVPSELRTRWALHFGSSKKLLPLLLGFAAPDLFIHDSLHTYRHMSWEFRTALLALRPGGAIIADDIEQNRAFEEALSHQRVRSWFATTQEGKKSICGVINIKPAETSEPNEDSGRPQLLSAARR